MAGVAAFHQPRLARWRATSGCAVLGAAMAFALLLLQLHATHGSLMQAGRYGRRLQQAAAKPAAAAPAAGAAAKPAAALCKWSPEDSVCSPTNLAWVMASTRAGRGLPSSPYRRAVMLASGRDERCQRSSSPAACAKRVKDRCFWQPGGTDSASCVSSDLQELLLWSSKSLQPDINVVPASMTCAGSPARAFFHCYAHLGDADACAALPQCMVLDGLGSVSAACVPRSFGNTTIGSLRVLLQGLEDLSPATHGSCAAACWLRQARACTNSSTSKAACEALPFCVYQEVVLDAKAKQAQIWGDDDSEAAGGASGSGNGTSSSSRTAAAKALKTPACRHQTQEFSSGNAVDEAAQEVYRQCRAAVAEVACGLVKASSAGGPPKPAKAGSFVPSAAPVKCQLS